MGCLFSKDGGDFGADAEQSLLASKPLYQKRESPRDAPEPEPVIPSFTRKAGGGGARAPSALDGAPPIPVFSSVGGAAGGAAAAPAPAAPKRPLQSSVFCPCGGPGARVKLLPCGHSALCLSCAQMEPACPACGEVVRDSVPSFRAAK
jgi:hypothetical protein